MVSRAQLDFVRARVNAGQQPWKTAYDQMSASDYASLSRTPKPRAVVECGPVSKPNFGCTDERQDAIAAYTDALAWYITGDTRYAAKAIALMDAWSAVIVDHTNANAPLQSGWSAASWTRAAEIIKHAYRNWPNAGRFATMLRKVYLPKVINGMPTYNGNWELVMMEAAIGIGVFLDDRAVYDRAMATFRARVPAFIYLAKDGPYPVPPAGTNIDTRSEIIDFWQGQSTFVDGLSQETCRDFTHTGYGLSSISHVAETARIQGDRVYTEVKERLQQALSLHAKYELGTAVPSWLCGGSVHHGLGPVTEVGFNALSFRLGIDMASTRSYTETKRPQGTNSLFVAWETLTHASNPN
ncbi:alginate lyase family protein [Catellatospora citrea]|uniref:Alginate lyase domain-containing protein n=1 Tax=Catellatospora citrea TaxID=53366 RepID=A0A8J3KN20_9ACTN|nr:alginate lyase family protein [Catellatospora citrea]GIG03133.1 hypothetical protein Cci01nite_82260 [Catellatospora citrea]